MPLIVVSAPGAQREANAGENKDVRAYVARLPGSVRQRTLAVRDPPRRMYSYTVMN